MKKLFAVLLFFLGSIAVAQPTRVSPDSAASQVPLTATFIWNEARDTSRYHLQVWEFVDSDSTMLVNDTTFVGDTSHSIAGLKVAAQYYWRMRVDSANTSVWSDYTSIWPFTIPTVVTRVYPTSGLTDVALADTIFWNKDTTVTFSLEVYSDIGLRNLVINQQTISDSLYVYTGLTKNTNYFWRMKKKFGGLSQPYTSVWQFTTVSDTPDVAVLLYPSDLETRVDTTLTLIWRQADRASEYALRVSKYSDLDSMEVYDDTLSTNSYLIQLSPSTTYYWRVSPGNSIGHRGFTANRRFTTRSRKVR